jgi:hypothetical protein
MRLCGPVTLSFGILLGGFPSAVGLTCWFFLLSTLRLSWVTEGPFFTTSGPRLFLLDDDSSVEDEASSSSLEDEYPGAVRVTQNDHGEFVPIVSVSEKKTGGARTTEISAAAESRGVVSSESVSLVETSESSRIEQQAAAQHGSQLLSQLAAELKNDAALHDEEEEHYARENEGTNAGTLSDVFATGDELVEAHTTNRVTPLPVREWLLHYAKLKRQSLGETQTPSSLVEKTSSVIASDSGRAEALQVADAVDSIGTKKRSGDHGKSEKKTKPASKKPFDPKTMINLDGNIIEMDPLTGEEKVTDANSNKTEIVSLTLAGHGKSREPTAKVTPLIRYIFCYLRRV